MKKLIRDLVTLRNMSDRTQTEVSADRVANLLC